jgi:hypothetical protein
MRLIRNTCCWAAVVCALLSFTRPAEGGWIRNGVGIASPDQTVTFDELGLPTLTIVTDQYAGLGVTLDPAFLQTYAPPSFAGVTGGYLSNFAFPETHDPFSIFFNAPVTAAAFVLATNPPTSSSDATTITAYLHGVQVGGPAVAFTFSNLADFAYIGLEDSLFDEFRINVQSNGRAFLDNVQFTLAPTVPEPTLSLLFGTGVVGLAARMRRRRAAQAGR